MLGVIFSHTFTLLPLFPVSCSPLENERSGGIYHAQRQALASLSSKRNVQLIARPLLIERQLSCHLVNKIAGR